MVQFWLNSARFRQITREESDLQNFTKFYRISFCTHQGVSRQGNNFPTHSAEYFEETFWRIRKENGSSKRSIWEQAEEDRVPSWLFGTRFGVSVWPWHRLAGHAHLAQLGRLRHCLYYDHRLPH